MVKLSVLAAVAAAALVPGAADAALLTFTITGDYRASFTIDSNPTPNEYIGATGLVLWDVDVVSQDGDGPADIGFFDRSLGGGLSIIDYSDFSPLFVADGPQLYLGTVQAPVFTTGIFQLVEYEGAGRYTLTIANAAAAPVPEPASWAMMLAGFGLAGTALRRRPRVTVRIA
jgi:hypothetical protein